ncbi:hypothetical protein CMV_023738 [Castanea mollissima]|uniref:Disease resistance R13L4/SHOC-2-like LRR domain-containing protein n=1 Tax=Castanea mollissima TaxID=60419 RepID=A0A8J4QBR0_9ROSI|nr:hypothetical protein CMV_023738 [Castanea mollissima]
MLQVVRRNEFGRPQRCKMHDILRELALSISVKEKFGVVHDGAEEMKECKARRISIHKTDGEFKSFTGRLINLQTLDIKDTHIDALPHGIGKLQNLRHLIMYRYTGNWNDFRYFIGMQAPSNIGQLKNLQTLCCFEAKGDLIRQIGSMTQLTSIGIGNVKEADEMDLCISIQNMRLLRVLTIMVTNEEETLRMDALLSPPPNLQNLILSGKLEKVPQWFRSLQSLTFLQLDWSRLEEDLLPHIATLPNLGRLILTNAYHGSSKGATYPKEVHLEVIQNVSRSVAVHPKYLHLVVIRECFMKNDAEDYEFASKGFCFVWSSNSKLSGYVNGNDFLHKFNEEDKAAMILLHIKHANC